MAKLNRREHLFFLAVAVLLAVPLFRLAEVRGDKLDKAQRQLAGNTATDCGVGQIRTFENNEFFMNEAVDACMVAAFQAKQPFRVRYDNVSDFGKNPSGNDSRGIVGTPQGQVYFFYYRYSSGWLRREYDYRQALCPDPKIDTLTSRQASYAMVGGQLTVNASDLTVKKSPIVVCGTCSYGNYNSPGIASCIIR